MPFVFSLGFKPKFNPPPHSFMLNYIAAVALFVAPAIAVPWTNATCVDQAWVGTSPFLVPTSGGRVCLFFLFKEHKESKENRATNQISFNSQTQSPCLVAAYLAAQCTTDNTFGIYALNDGGPYGFIASAANNCLCNSVVWNLLSACALCQRELSGSWGQWVASCPSNLINVAKYPLPLPAGVAVPSWAYYDFTVAGTFNSVIASQQLGLKSSAVSGATSTPVSVPSSIVPSSEATLTGATGSTLVPKPITSQSASSSNTGAIIGGVVGGVLGICLIGLIAFVLTRRRKSDEPANKYPEINHKSPMASAFNGATPMAGQVPPYQFGAPNQPVSTPEYKPYDPSDPSTFPTGPATPENGHYVESLPYPYQPQIPGQLSHPNVPQV